MARYIDVDALLQDIERTIDDSGCVNHEREIMDCIRYAPTVETNRRGSWEYIGTVEDCAFWKCNSCNRHTFSECLGPGKIVIYKFCPNCGARMESAEYDPN